MGNEFELITGVLRFGGNSNNQIADLALLALMCDIAMQHLPLMRAMTSSFDICHHIYTKIINAESDCMNATLSLGLYNLSLDFFIYRFNNNEDILRDISIFTLLSVKHNTNSF